MFELKSTQIFLSCNYLWSVIYFTLRISKSRSIEAFCKNFTCKRVFIRFCATGVKHSKSDLQRLL